MKHSSGRTRFKTGETCLATSLYRIDAPVGSEGDQALPAPHEKKVQVGQNEPFPEGPNGRPCWWTYVS